MCEKYGMAVDYHPYRLIHKLQRYDCNVALEMQKMCKKVAVDMQDQDYNETNTD